jgi:uncharacterized protein (TIGR02145 family)
MKTHFIFKLILPTILIGLFYSCNNKDDLRNDSLINDSTLIDIEGNTYKVLTIGSQTWMVENLKTTTYNDGTPIPNITNDSDWYNMTSGAYCNYNNDFIYVYTYGRLYNWFSVNTCKLCPTGWHVPTDTEWTELSDYLIDNGYGFNGDGDDIAKSLASTSLWDTLSEEAFIGCICYDLSINNSSGFNAFPCGFRDNIGPFALSGVLANWWSSTEYSPEKAYDRHLYHYWDKMLRGERNKARGLSVRCIKD